MPSRSPHVGDIYGARHPGLLLESADRLIRSGALDPARLRIRLTGPLDRSAIRNADLFDSLAARGVVRLEPRVSRRESHRVMATAHYLLALDVFHHLPPLQLPAKISDYVRVGRPVLACTRRGSPLTHVLAMSGVRCAFLYEDDSPAELDRKLLDFLKLPADPLPLAREFREGFEAPRQAARLAGIIDTVAGVRALTAAAATVR